jgi:hypothetical protein
LLHELTQRKSVLSRTNGHVENTQEDTNAKRRATQNLVSYRCLTSITVPSAGDRSSLSSQGQDRWGSRKNIRTQIKNKPRSVSLMKIAHYGTRPQPPQATASITAATTAG